MPAKVHTCQNCGARLPRDVVALNRKLRPVQANQRSFLCLECFASFLDCTSEDLLDKIQQFKEEGCRLFR